VNVAELFVLLKLAEELVATVFVALVSQYNEAVKLLYEVVPDSPGCSTKQAAGSTKPVSILPLVFLILLLGMNEGKIWDEDRRRSNNHASTKVTDIRTKRMPPRILLFLKYICTNAIDPIWAALEISTRRNTRL